MLLLRVVKRLSNLFGHRDAAASAAEPLDIRPAHGDEVHSAMRWILGTHGDLASDETVVDFLRYAVQRKINLQDLWVATRGPRMAWATLSVVSAGRTMLLLAPPRIDDDVQADAAGRLLDAISPHFAARNIQLAQVLLDPPADGLHAMYLAHGFDPMAELIYLQRTVRRAEAPRLPAGFTLRTMTQEYPARFASTILATYQQSLDCPALNGVRNIDDVMASHRATGEFDPDLWFLLCEHDVPLGTLLLSRVTNTDALELVYLGLTPAARGRGMGDLLMQQAIWMVASHNLLRLTLAVDAINQPALGLYYRHGMGQVATKSALMRKLFLNSTPHPHVQ